MIIDTIEPDMDEKTPQDVTVIDPEAEEIDARPRADDRTYLCARPEMVVETKQRRGLLMLCRYR